MNIHDTHCTKRLAGWISVAKNMPQDRAKAMLTELGVKVGEFVETNSPQGYVLRQFLNCEVPDEQTLSRLEKYWGTFIWGLSCPCGGRP